MYIMLRIVCKMQVDLRGKGGGGGWQVLTRGEGGEKF